MPGSFLRVSHCAFHVEHKGKYSSHSEVPQHVAIGFGMVDVERPVVHAEAVFACTGMELVQLCHEASPIQQSDLNLRGGLRQRAGACSIRTHVGHCTPACAEDVPMKGMLHYRRGARDTRRQVRGSTQGPLREAGTGNMRGRYAYPRGPIFRPRPCASRQPWVRSAGSRLDPTGMQLHHPVAGPGAVGWWSSADKSHMPGA